MFFSFEISLVSISLFLFSFSIISNVFKLSIFSFIIGFNSFIILSDIIFIRLLINKFKESLNEVPFVSNIFKLILNILSIISFLISIILISINGIKASIIFCWINSSLESSQICSKHLIIASDCSLFIKLLDIILYKTIKDVTYILFTLFWPINNIGLINLSIDSFIFSSNLSKEDSFN